MYRKVLFTFLVVSICISSAFSQVRQAGTPVPKTMQRDAFSATPISHLRDGGLVQDTIFPPNFLLDTCSLTPFNFGITDRWGFIGGTNEFLDQEIAQRFQYSATDSFTVEEAWVWFGVANLGSDGSLTLKVYEVDATSGGPGTLLATSEAVKASDILVSDTTISATSFSFAAPPTVKDDEFFLSLVIEPLYTSNDTVSILMTDVDCGDGFDAWALIDDGVTWFPFDSVATWDLESNLFMTAILQFDELSGVEDAFIEQNGLQLYPAYPNPATNTVRIEYDLNSSTNVSIEIYSIDGRLIQKIDKSRQAAGHYQEQIDTRKFINGSYIYGVVTEEARMMSKFVVGR